MSRLAYGHYRVTRRAPAGVLRDLPDEGVLPEFNSRPTAPHPLFVAFVKAAACRAAKRPAEPPAEEFTITFRPKVGEMRVVSGKVPAGSIFAGVPGDQT